MREIVVISIILFFHLIFNSHSCSPSARLIYIIFHFWQLKMLTTNLISGISIVCRLCNFFIKVKLRTNMHMFFFICYFSCIFSSDKKKSFTSIWKKSILFLYPIWMRCIFSYKFLSLQTVFFISKGWTNSRWKVPQAGGSDDFHRIKGNISKNLIILIISRRSMYLNTCGRKERSYFASPLRNISIFSRKFYPMLEFHFKPPYFKILTTPIRQQIWKLTPLSWNFDVTLKLSNELPISS